MKTKRIVVNGILFLTVLISAFTLITNVQAAPNCQSNSVCEAWKILQPLTKTIYAAGGVFDIYPYGAVALGWINRRIDEGFLPEGYTMDKFIKTLNAAGFEFKSTNNIGQQRWVKKANWKDPCQPPPAAPAGQTEPVRNDNPDSIQIAIILGGLGGLVLIFMLRR